MCLFFLNSLWQHLGYLARENANHTLTSRDNGNLATTLSLVRSFSLNPRPHDVWFFCNHLFRNAAPPKWFSFARYFIICSSPWTSSPWKWRQRSFKVEKEEANDPKDQLMEKSWPNKKWITVNHRCTLHLRQTLYVLQMAQQKLLVRLSIQPHSSPGAVPYLDEVLNYWDTPIHSWCVIEWNVSKISECLS